MLKQQIEDNNKIKKMEEYNLFLKQQIEDKKKEYILNLNFFHRKIF